MFGRTEQPQHPEPYNDPTDPATGLPHTHYHPERKLSNAALRRELWRDNPQQSVEDHADITKGYSQSGGTHPLPQPHQHQSPFQHPTTQLRLLPHNHPSSNASLSPGDVFKFDSFDRDRYLPRGLDETLASAPPSHFFIPHHGISLGHAPQVVQPPQATHSIFCTTSFHQHHPCSLGSRLHNPEEIGEDVFTPASGRSPNSSLSSPQVSVESPRVCFSPLKIKDSIEEEDETGLVIHRLPRLSVRGCDGDEPQSLGYTPLLGRGVHVHLGTSHHQVRCYEQRLLPGQGRSALSRSISPNPTVSYQASASRHFQSQEENIKRRCMSDTDLSRDLEERMVMVMVKDNYHHINPITAKSHMLRPQKGGSLESEGSSVQDSPLDLSIRSSISSTTSSQSISVATLQTTLSFENIPKKRPGRGRGRGRSRSTNFGRGASSLSGDRLSLERFEESSEAGTPPLQYNCNHCEQVFSMANRLAKHMSSRHKSRSVECINKLPHICEICNRCFSRSDMLTRHMRLHTGVKPYPCKICNQVFSRSDHLSTHQRTHTGEKPYNCPSCPYAACRRDMITRHMKTHESQGTSLDHDSQNMDRMGVRRSSVAARSRSHESERPVFGMFHQYSDADRRRNLRVQESCSQPE